MLITFVMKQCSETATNIRVEFPGPSVPSTNTALMSALTINRWWEDETLVGRRHCEGED